MKLFMAVALASVAVAQTWTPQSSGTQASLRGISAVSANVAWASGTGGTYLETTDAGETWRAGVVPGAGSLDFRGVYGVDARTAYLVSSGEGDKSRIYKTDDGGAHWNLQLTNPDPKGFWDTIAFWNPRHAMVAGDPVAGRFAILTTYDGEHWIRREGPAALANEGAFAASNSCLIVRGAQEAWLASGGPGTARVFHSKDGGVTWTVTTTPIRNDGASAGIFSLAFSDDSHGIAVGGDYTKAGDESRNMAITADGGKTWREPSGQRPKGFRSAVIYLPGRAFWIATGPSGSDYSSDNGNSWKPFDTGDYNAIGFTADGTGWAAGPRGRIAKFTSARRDP